MSNHQTTIYKSETSLQTFHSLFQSETSLQTSHSLFQRKTALKTSHFLFQSETALNTSPCFRARLLYRPLTPCFRARLLYRPLTPCFRARLLYRPLTPCFRARQLYKSNTPKYKLRTSGKVFVDPVSIQSEKMDELLKGNDNTQDFQTNAQHSIHSPRKETQGTILDSLALSVDSFKIKKASDSGPSSSAELMYDESLPKIFEQRQHFLTNDVDDKKKIYGRHKHLKFMDQDSTKKVLAEENPLHGEISNNKGSFDDYNNNDYIDNYGELQGLDSKHKGATSNKGYHRNPTRKKPLLKVKNTTWEHNKEPASSLQKEDEPLGSSLKKENEPLVSTYHNSDLNQETGGLEEEQFFAVPISQILKTSTPLKFVANKEKKSELEVPFTSNLANDDDHGSSEGQGGPLKCKYSDDRACPESKIRQDIRRMISNIAEEVRQEVLLKRAQAKLTDDKQSWERVNPG
uniref:Uncharacterized protein n=1 Tax=Timema cristinae TaxID=61476 RepID=A0A7R9CXG3_TIMCR|nr:unnamed protein product [Timema cristinae]